MSEKAEEAGNFTFAADLLKMAAQDRGGMFTNKREVKIDDPAAVLAGLLNITPEELPGGESERIN